MYRSPPCPEQQKGLSGGHQFTHSGGAEALVPGWMCCGSALPTCPPAEHVSLSLWGGTVPQREEECYPWKRWRRDTGQGERAPDEGLCTHPAGH